MNDNKFEQLWREALDNAAEKAPSSVWENIESQLEKEDDSLENTFFQTLALASEEVPEDIWNNINNELNASEVTLEEEFSNAFAAASVNPPENVWLGIKAELDEENDRKPVVFFWSNRWIAAGIAALLILAFGTPLMLNWNSENDSAISKLPNEGLESLSKAAAESENTTNKPLGLNSINDSETIEAQSSESREEGSNSQIAQFKSKAGGSSSERKQTSSVLTSNPTIIDAEKSINVETRLEKLWNSAIAKLNIRAFSPYGARFTFNRKKLAFDYSEEEQLAMNKGVKNRSWLGFMSGFAPFDPNISITNFERQALVSARDVPNNFFEYKSVVETTPINGNQSFEIPLSQPFNNVRQGSAINLGLDYGFKVTNRVSIQTGARYTRGSSFIQSNVYSYNRSTGDVSTFLESHYLAIDQDRNNNTLISSAEDVKNAYQFLVVPFQLGYHQPIMKKLEASVSAGVSGDFMINNVLDDTPVGGSKLTPSNSAYKRANLSALGSLKLTYQVNTNWDASFGANMQRALSSGVDATQNFTFMPRFFGVSYGVNYRFK